MSGQRTLLPSAAPTVCRETLPLEPIDGFEDAAPSAKLAVPGAQRTTFRELPGGLSRGSITFA